MAADKKQKLDFDLQGLRYFRQLKPLLTQLASIGTERDQAANRRLVMDQYCTLILLWLYVQISRATLTTTRNALSR